MIIITVDHLIILCSYIAQTEYKKRHDKVAHFIHWKLAELHGFDLVSQWWTHKPEQVMNNPAYTLMWDFTITVDSPTPHN